MGLILLPRYSAIDIGSNAFRLVIAEKVSESQFRILKKERVAVRLGADAFEQGFFSEETMDQAINAFKKFQTLHKKYKVKSYIACATSAMRESKNSSKLIEALQQKAKIKVQVIDGLQEGHLIRQAVYQEVFLNKAKTCFIDIGGGSVEITFNSNGSLLESKSFPMGTVRTLQMRKTLSVEQNLIRYKKLIGPYILKHLKKTKKFDFAVGTGGNIESLGRLRVQMLGKLPNTRLTLKDLIEMRKRLNQLNLLERIETYQLRPDRADVIIPALDVLILILNLTHIQEIKVPYVGLREGLLLRLTRP